MTVTREANFAGNIRKGPLGVENQIDRSSNPELELVPVEADTHLLLEHPAEMERRTADLPADLVE